MPQNSTAIFSPRVIYVPAHAEGDVNHPDCERGAVSSVNDKFVFVKFDKHVEQLGWDGATSQACDPSNLVFENRRVLPD